jgi:hypothetical protein
VDFSDVQSCLDVSDAHIARAMEPARSLSDETPRDKMLALLRHMAAVARPRSGAPRMLVLLAKMAARDWMEGDAVVELSSEDDRTTLTLLVDDGLSQERLAGPLVIQAPLFEFSHAVRTSPHVLVPLRLEGDIEASGLTLRRSRMSQLPKRGPSYSALAIELMPALARQLKVEGRRPPTTKEPERPPPLPQRHKKGRA